MPSLTHDLAQRAYFALGVPDERSAFLADLRWQPCTEQRGAWWTRSPLLAAPLWAWIDPRDEPTRAALWSYAWNYATSFAREPLRGTGIDAVRLPAGSRPYPFQVAGVQRIMLRQRLLLGDDRGTGKTFQALAAVNLLRPKRVLVGCPAFLVDNWAAECERWLVDPQPVTILGRGKRGVPDRGVLILPYSKGHRFAEQIARSGPVDYLIADQVEMLKSPGARRTQPWLGDDGLFARATRVVATTGSPIPNNPMEIHGLLGALAPESRVSAEAFKREYCSTSVGSAAVQKKSGGTTQVEFEKNSGKNEAALNAELRASGVMVRRLKTEVLDQFPPKSVYLVHLSPTAAIEDLVREELTLYEMLEARLLPAQDVISLQGHIANVRARLGLLKAPKIAEYVRWVFDEGEDRVVLFMLHLAAIEAVRLAFDSGYVRTRVLTGAQSPRQRDDDVREFQRPGGRELAICQIKAAGLGLTMTAARVVVMGEIAWTPTDNDEAIDRVWRISQTRQVEAPILTFPHAVEQRVLQSAARKAISAQRILDVNLQKLVDVNQT